MNRLRLSLAGLLLGSTLTIGFAQGGVTAEPGEVVVPQAGCADGEFELSGTVTSGGSAYQTWVEYRFETNGTPVSSGPWLNDTGSVAATDAQGAYSLCVPTTMEFDEIETVTRVQVFAYPDLTSWDGSATPAVGFTGGTIRNASSCASGCTSNIAMAAPTVWANSAADFFFVFSGQTYLTNFPAYRPASANTVSNLGKMAAAFPFLPNSPFQIRGNDDTSGNPLDNNYGFTYAYSRNVTTNGSGVVGAIGAPNFFVDFNFPPAVAEPVRGDNGQWPNGSWANVFVYRLDGACATNFLQDPSCRLAIDQYEPLRVAAQLTPSIPYAIAASAGILPISFRIVMMDANGNLAYARSSQLLQSSPSTQAGPLTDATPFVLNMDPPKFFLGSVNGASTVPNTTAFAEKWDENACGGNGCFNYQPAYQPSSGGAGVFGWSPTDGIWRVVLYPGNDHVFSSAGPNWARTPHYLKVTTTNFVTTISDTCTLVNNAPVCNGAAPTPNGNGVTELAIDRANVVVSVIGLDGQPVPNESIEIGPSNQDWSQYGMPTTSGGRAGLNLAAGSWRVIARAPDGDLDQAAGSLVFTVDADDTTSAPLFVTVSLSEPNVKGRVLKPDTTPSRFSGVQVQIFDAQMNGPRNVRWAPTDINGNFAINLGEGVYKLTLDAPASDPNLPRTSYFVKISSAGVPCLVSAFNDATCDADPPQDRFVFVFDTPNLLGRLVLDSGDGVSGWVSADKWNGTRFDWSDNGAQVDAAGNFSLVLDDGATYRLTAEPRASSGASRTTVYITMGTDGDWCQTTADPITETPAVCTPGDNGVLNVQAAGANFRGSVSAANTSITQGWVDASVETDFGWRFFAGAQVRRDGTFALRVERSGSEWEQVKITANPPWGDSTLVKESRLYWVRGSDICADVARPTTTCTSPVTPTSSQLFVLSGGNVSGEVTLPDSGDPAGFVHISVEQQNDEGWWEWIDVWAQTDVNGQYSLGLENGDYRITARPFNRDGVSPTSIEITVDDACAGCDSADIVLSPPNVTATIKAPGGATTVQQAWVGVERKKINCRNQGCTQFDVWWEWTGYGSESDAQGQVEISVPVTNTAETYRLVVNSPWGSQTVYPRFNSAEFTLQSTGNTEQAFPNLTFPSANVNIVLLNGQSTVANSWVGLEIWNGTYWQWADVGSNTSVSGKVSLYLPCLAQGAQNPCVASDVRVVVDSPWGATTALPRFTKSLATVLAAADVAGFKPLSFPSSNVSGRFRIDANTTNRNGWVEVFQWNAGNSTIGSWVTGNPVNRQGQLSMALADGTYLLRSHSNGTIAAVPIEMIVVVTNGAFVSCTYRSGGSCSSVEFNIDVSFADRPKNLSLAVTLNGAALTRSAFVTLESVSLGVSISLVTSDTGLILASVPAANDYTISVVLPTTGSNVATGSLNTQTIGASTGNDRTTITVAL